MSSAEKVENEREIRMALQQAGFFRHLGFHLDALGKGFCTVSVSFSSELSQHNGLFHGAVYAALVDVSTAGAAATVVRPDHTILTAEYKLNILRAVKEVTLKCEASVLKSGRQLSVVQANVHAISDTGTELAATALATLANVPFSAHGVR